jgi:hypothetical protein
MKLLRAFLLGVLVVSAQTVTITGTFRNPDTTPVNGTLSVWLTETTINNSCTTPAQVVTFKRVNVPIVNGTLGSLSLYPSPCLFEGSISFPTFVPMDGAGAGATVTGTGDNRAGQFTLVTGTTPLANSQQMQMVFTTTGGGSLPYCTLQPATSNAPGGSSYNFDIGRSNTTLTITSGSLPLAASTAYSWKYLCAKPYVVQVKNQAGVQLYKGLWAVPNTSPIDVTQLDKN